MYPAALFWLVSRPEFTLGSIFCDDIAKISKNSEASLQIFPKNKNSELSIFNLPGCKRGNTFFQVSGFLG
jgi:hypothetical protein